MGKCLKVAIHGFPCRNGDLPLSFGTREKHAFGSLEVASSSSHLKTHLDPCAPVTVMIKGEKKL